MNAPRPTALVHPVTGVGSFFAFGGRGELGSGCLFGDGVGRAWFYDFRACDVVEEAYWGICLDWFSCARTVFLVRRVAGGERRMVREVAVSIARCSGFSARCAVGGSRRTFGMGRRAVGVKIRAVRPDRRTGRVVRWSFLSEIVRELVKRRAVALSAVECGPDVSGLPLFPASLLAMSLLASRSRVAMCFRSGWPFSRMDAFCRSALRATPAGWRGESGSRLPHSAVLRTLI